MKPQKNWAVAVVAIATMCLAGCAGGTGETDGPTDGGETFTLRYSSHVLESSYTNSAAKAWMNEVEERSGGRITFETYYSGALCAYAEALACLSDGRADLTTVGGLNHPSELPTMSITGLPFQSTNSAAVAAALRDLYNDNDAFQQEWTNAGVKPLVFQPTENILIGSKFPMETLDDLTGHSVRATGYVTQAVDAIGMTPVQMDFTEIYEALDRGAIDSWMTSLEGVVSASLYEVTDFIVDPGVGVYTGQAAPAMSLTAYESLPEDLQQIIDETALESEQNWSADYFVPGMEEVCAATMEDVGSFTTLPESEIEKWKDELGDSADQQWIENVTAAGVQDAEQLLADFRDFIVEEESSYEPVLQSEICNSL